MRFLELIPPVTGSLYPVTDTPLFVAVALCSVILNMWLPFSRSPHANGMALLEVRLIFQEGDRRTLLLAN